MLEKSVFDENERKFIKEIEEDTEKYIEFLFNKANDFIKKNMFNEANDCYFEMEMQNLNEQPHTVWWKVYLIGWQLYLNYNNIDYLTNCELFCEALKYGEIAIECCQSQECADEYRKVIEYNNKNMNNETSSIQCIFHSLRTPNSVFVSYEDDNQEEQKELKLKQQFKEINEKFNENLNETYLAEKNNCNTFDEKMLKMSKEEILKALYKRIYNYKEKKVEYTQLATIINDLHHVLKFVLNSDIKYNEVNKTDYSYQNNSSWTLQICLNKSLKEWLEDFNQKILYWNGTDETSYSNIEHYLDIVKCYIDTGIIDYKNCLIR